MSVSLYLVTIKHLIILFLFLELSLYFQNPGLQYVFVCLGLASSAIWWPSSHIWPTSGNPNGTSVGVQMN